MSDRKLTEKITVRSRTPADPLSLESLIAWLETMPPKGGYDYTNNENCLLCQYLRASGFDVVTLSPYDWMDSDIGFHTLPEGWNEIANDRDETFGAALSRAIALSKEKA